MMSRPPISPGKSRAATASRSLCGLSRGKSATALLPRPGEERSARAIEGGAPGDHPMSVAMPDSPANSGETGRPVTGHKVRVMLPLPLPEPLDYLVTDGAAAAPGAAPVCRARRRLYSRRPGRGAAHGDERRGGVAAAPAAPGLRHN